MKPGFFTLSHCRWIPWAIVGCFVVVAAMNGGLAYLALESDPGLVSEHPFELGNGYNRVLAEGAAEDALGWRGAADFLPTERLSGWVVATLRDSAGAPLCRGGRPG